MLGIVCGQEATAGGIFQGVVCQTKGGRPAGISSLAHKKRKERLSHLRSVSIRLYNHGNATQTEHISDNRYNRSQRKGKLQKDDPMVLFIHLGCELTGSSESNYILELWIHNLGFRTRLNMMDRVMEL
jgi:hypothetical protein